MISVTKQGPSIRTEFGRESSRSDFIKTFFSKKKFSDFTNIFIDLIYVNCYGATITILFIIKKAN